MGDHDLPLQIFSTCPQSKDHTAADFPRRVIEAAGWSDAAGCTGMLVYTDNSLVDPWLIAGLILAHTERLCPLVAVQPLYLHPYAAAKMVASLAFLYRRRVFLNMLAGGFRADLQALGDPTAHDERYARTTEYTLIIRALLESASPISFEGRHYTVKNLRMTPPCPPELMPGILISGSSEAGMAAARETGAVAIVYPQPAAEQPENRAGAAGVRVGIIARPDPDEAWAIAHARFPADDRGRLTHKLAMATSDSVWHRQLSERADHPDGGDSPYWLWPFQTYKTFCPYLVGGLDEVAAHLALYLAKGYRTFILDVPRSPDELAWTQAAFRRALGMGSV